MILTVINVKALLEPKGMPVRW